MHAHRRLLTDVLKDEWGFDGVVVGDADGVRNLIPHGVAEDLADAVRQSLTARASTSRWAARRPALHARSSPSPSTPRASMTPSRASSP